MPAIADREIGDSRVLPAFASDNYVSLLPGEEKQLTIECAAEDLGNEPPIVTLDGWIIARQCSR
ncbi:MAG: hypothetical protein IT426_03385 [Pirellulales bacterium]|nr:hypothetical protein [Pirellulales bacterium]